MRLHALVFSAIYAKMAASAGGVGARAVNGEGLKSGQKATSVSVDDSETWVEAKRYTVYKVVVRKADKAYFVFRRCVSIPLPYSVYCGPSGSFQRLWERLLAMCHPLFIAALFRHAYH